MKETSQSQIVSMKPSFEMANRVLNWKMWIIPSMMSIPKVQTIYLSLYSTYTDYRLWKKYAEELRGNRAKKRFKAKLNSLPPRDAATLALIHLTISISLELAKALSITILRQKLAKISLSHQKR